MAVGSRYRHERSLAAAVLAHLRNHVADEDGLYFDGLGSDIHGRYDHAPPLRLVAGWNYLAPDDTEYPGPFRTDEYYVGLHYTFNDRTFDDMVYIEYKLDSGRTAYGYGRPNILAFGLRYSFTH